MAFAVMLLSMLPSGAATVNLTAVEDTTLSELDSDNNFGGLTFLIAGTAGSSSQGLPARRALVRFDLASIPQGATIVSASVSGTVTLGRGGTTTHGLHRVNQDWSEGDKSFTTQIGRGSPASTAETTWNSAGHGVTAWTQAGGDFEGVASGVGDLGISGSFSITGTGLAADVQAWVDGTHGNFGWALVAANEGNPFDARRIGSVEGGQAMVLTVEFTVPAPGPMLANPTVLSGGEFQFTVVTEQDSRTVVEFSRDLKMWNHLDTRDPAPATFSITDENAPLEDHLFYRVSIQPATE